MELKIIKKNGCIEKFNVEKLERSIKNSAKDINFSLNYSDVKLISNEVLKIINSLHKEEKITNSYEVIAITINVLKKNKFDIIIPSYLCII
ncbi:MULTISPECIES: ATP cone domain-containing protein [Clostridium]|uniref:ATP cone domain-containing protein n=1 Tax=Clostridium TaxID=1485 RepID=UPI00232D1919|nr:MULTISPECIES: ATP cone domain-containing protein [Clostridium]MDB2104838.1 ATP cone domain-containing protein [Clostridium paraputrificum]MDU2108696.1 ATP cone domain-containing protein [Clostridium sp.]MDU3355193.1 ATP cone domain-containing protein [Clostridium sp.]MDU4727949.1 ATP cone domain-containing protein [Clostridium sp.]